MTQSDEASALSPADLEATAKVFLRCFCHSGTHPALPHKNNDCPSFLDMAFWFGILAMPIFLKAAVSQTNPPNVEV